MKANQLVHLLVPAIILSLPANTNNWGEIDDGASSFVIGESKEKFNYSWWFFGGG